MGKRRGRKSKQKQTAGKCWMFMWVALGYALAFSWSSLIGGAPERVRIWATSLNKFNTSALDEQRMRPMGGVHEENNTALHHRRYPKFAYSFVISGCTKTSCTGYILNVLAATSLLASVNSTAHVLLQVRMAAVTNLTALPQEQEVWLRKAGVQLRYLSKVKHDNFGIASLEKFRPLELSLYDRILFLDSDMIPLCNLDYLMEESYAANGAISEYVMLSAPATPATASIILYTPKPGVFDRVLEIVRQHRNRTTRPNEFDPVLGWGHTITHPLDQWESLQRNSNLWNFHGVSADQGILYHWMHYVQRNHSHIRWNVVEEWRDVSHQIAHWKNKTQVVFPIDEPRNKTYIAKVSTRQGVFHGCGGAILHPFTKRAPPPYSDILHLAGGNKPWNAPILAEDISRDYAQVANDPRGVWLYWLGQANQTFGLNLLPRIVLKPGSPLGGKPVPQDLLAPDIELPVPLPF